ncbi:adam protein [Clonorchis sinensis]|uniref:Adam protein n=1 Tax=Clonorchis sinensis TaxID=79923 RepID=G7YET7_CLOSI|nr:adam protein [Clonorchis sinensis]
MVIPASMSLDLAPHGIGVNADIIGIMVDMESVTTIDFPVITVTPKSRFPQHPAVAFPAPPELSSLGSSSSTNPNSSVGLSGGSSSWSGMISATGHHFHRRHRLVRARKNTDDDATSGSRRSSPVHTVPTILCSAGQQTDELSL